jgi:hypothetical protein
MASVKRALNAASAVAADSDEAAEHSDSSSSSSTSSTSSTSSASASASLQAAADGVLPGFIDEITKTQIIAPAIAPSTGIVLGYQTYCSVLNRNPKNRYALSVVTFFFCCSAHCCDVM